MMDGVILILKLGLLIRFGFTESSEDHTSAIKLLQPNLDLECLNDYLTEMMCRLTPDQLETCSEYSLNAYYNKESLHCDFKLNSDACECSLQVTPGFVVGENFKIDVMRRKNFMLTKNIDTADSIKPKKPAIVSVNQTENGNFRIKWETEYNISERVFAAGLITELVYYKEGSKENGKIVNLSEGQKDYEIIGRNLESKSIYYVKARVKSELNSRFSDYSEPYRFTTPLYLQDSLSIMIPIICVTLICIIFAIYCAYSKIRTEWWEKVPTPKIATSFVKQVPNLTSFQNEFSPVHLDSSMVVHAGEKTCPASSLVDVRRENSLNSLGKDGNSAGVIYGQTGNESLEETNMEKITHWECAKESQLTNHCQIAMSNQYYKNQKTGSDDCNVGQECGNSSGISNKFYMFSLSDKFQSPAIRNGIDDFNESESKLPLLAKNLDPKIPVDFEYGPCTGCSESENTSPTRFTPPSNDITVVPGYQSVNEADCTPTDQAFICSHNDVNLIMDKLICKNPQKISSETTILPVENGYKDFQSLLRNSGEQQMRTTEPELKHLSGLPLHTVPGIQIDCSYHRV